MTDRIDHLAAMCRCGHNRRDHIADNQPVFYRGTCIQCPCNRFESQSETSRRQPWQRQVRSGSPQAQPIFVASSSRTRPITGVACGAGLNTRRIPGWRISLRGVRQFWGSFSELAW